MFIFVAVLIAQRAFRGPSDVADAQPPMRGPAGGDQRDTPGGRAPDISSMAPEERASRLFDRVMRYAEEGKQDSARFFAPMAIQSYEMMGPPDAHARYDIGMIGLVSGDPVLARAEADTILAADRTHLLGLVLAIKAAGIRGDRPARADYHTRLLAAAPELRASPRKEYVEHKADIDAAVADAKAPKP